MNSRSISVTLSKLKNQSLKLADELPTMYAEPLAWARKNIRSWGSINLDKMSANRLDL